MKQLEEQLLQKLKDSFVGINEAKISDNQKDKIKKLIKELQRLNKADNEHVKNAIEMLSKDLTESSCACKIAQMAEEDPEKLIDTLEQYGKGDINSLFEDTSDGSCGDIVGYETVNEDIIDEANKERFIKKLPLERWQKDTLIQIMADSPQLHSRVDWHHADEITWDEWQNIIMGKSLRAKYGISKKSDRKSDWDIGESKNTDRTEPTAEQAILESLTSKQGN